MCTVWKCKSTQARKAKLLWTTPHWWANRCTKCHGNTVSRSHLISHYVNKGEFVIFIGNYILWRPPHSGIIFDSQATTLTLTLTVTIDLLNPKSMGFYRLSRTTIVPSFKSFRSGFSLYCANTPTHIVTKWSPTSHSSARIKISRIMQSAVTAFSNKKLSYRWQTRAMRL